MAVLGALPLAGNAGETTATTVVPADVQDILRAVDDTARRVLAPVTETVDRLEKATSEATRAPVKRQAAALDPATEPPLHGANPHGQGSVAVLDVQPSEDRPTGDDPVGSNTGEEAVVGRAKGEQKADGTYHGHITIAALFGNEVLGVDTGPGQTEAGPLDPLQTNVLDAVCSGSANNICVSAVRADSATTSSGSTNKFSTANAAVGGPAGIGVGAAESNGNASSDGTCQTTTGNSSVANVSAGGSAVAGVANSSTESKACKGQAPQQTNRSRVLELGGTGVPIPAAGCADGTADTVTGIPTLAPIVCNADETNSAQAPTPSGVREALSVFALATGATSVLKATTAASESAAKAPPTQCADGIDNDGDGLADGADGGCHTDGNPDNPASFNPADDDESGGRAPGSGTEGEGEQNRAACSDGRDNDGDGLVDRRDPGCHSDGDPNNDASYNADDTSEGGRPAQCADGRDNDGDGRIDAADPGCHTDGDASNPDSYEPRDDSEADGAQCSDNRDNDGDGRIDARDPGCHTDGDASNPDSYDPGDDSEGDQRQAGLPFTGSNVLGLALIGLLLLAAGLGLRRPLGTR